jgi:LuxR family transcriptional regulator, maltose regulon positive regulatory protein
MASIHPKLATLLAHGQVPAASEPFVKSSSLVFRAVHDNWNGNFHNAILHAQEALTIALPEWRLLRSYAWVHLGNALAFTQGTQAAVHTLTAELFQHNEMSVPERIRRQVTLALIYWQAGNLTKLRQECELGIKLSEAHQDAAASTVNLLHLYLGHVFYQRNELAEAGIHFSKATQRPLLAHRDGLVMGVFGQALVHQAQGEVAEAQRVIESGIEFCLEHEATHLLAFVRGFQIELAWRQGHLEQTYSWVKQLDSTQLPSLLPWPYDLRFTLCHLLLAQKTTASLARAEVELSRLMAIAEKSDNKWVKLQGLAWQALLYDAQHKWDLAVSTLHSLVKLAEEENFIRLLVDAGPAMAQLCQKVYALEPRTPFVQNLLTAFNPNSHPKQNHHHNRLLSTLSPLTEREMEVLALLAQRYSNKEIGRELVITPETVKRHTINIYQKLGVGSRRQAVSEAHRMGLLESEPLHTVDYNKFQ